MLDKMQRRSRILVGALLCAVLVCCVKFEQVAVLYPDGSGKIEMLIAVREDIAELAEATDDDPFADFKDPLLLQTNTDGFAAWTPATKKVSDGWVEMRLTGYFVDISAAKYYDVRGSETEGGVDKLAVGFDYKESEGLHTLSIHNDIANKVPSSLFESDGKPNPMAEIMEGFRVEVVVTVPGKIEAIEGLTKDGRTAKLLIDAALLFGVEGESAAEKTERIRMPKAPDGRHVSWRDASVDEEEVAQFKSELEAVKTQWLKRLEEAKAKD